MLLYREACNTSECMVTQQPKLSDASLLSCYVFSCRNKQYAQALKSAEEAGDLNEKLAGQDIDWEIVGVHESKEFRMLVPLGFQFKADMMNTLRKDEDAGLDDSLDLGDVVSAYREAINTPPLNNSSKSV